MRKQTPRRVTELFVRVGSHKAEVKPEKAPSPPVLALYLTAGKPGSETALEPGQALGCTFFIPASPIGCPSSSKAETQVSVSVSMTDK